MATITVKPGDNIQEAANRIQDGDTLYFTNGEYALNTQIYIGNSRSCTVLGESRAKTVLRWTTHDETGRSWQGGIKFDGIERAKHRFEISNVTLETATKYGGAALELAWGAGPKMPTGFVRNVTIIRSPANSEAMWKWGIRLRNATEFTIDDVKIEGCVPGARQQQDENFGIHISGDNVKVNASQIHMNNLSVENYRTGLAARESCEGIYASRFELRACVIGIDLHRFSTAIFTNGHIDYLVHGLIATQSNTVTVNAVYIKTHDGVRGTGLRNSDAVRFMHTKDEERNRFPEALPRDPAFEGSQTLHVVGGTTLHFSGVAGHSDPNASGVVLSKRDESKRDEGNRHSEGAIIGNCTLLGFPGKGVLFGAGTRRNRAVGNQFVSCGRNCVDESQSNECGA